MNLFPGFKIWTNGLLTDSRFVFPPDRFVEWGPEDESYCRLAGFGRDEHVPRMVIYQVGDMLIMHPAMLARLQKAKLMDGEIFLQRDSRGHLHPIQPGAVLTARR